MVPVVPPGAGVPGAGVAVGAGVPGAGVAAGLAPVSVACGVVGGVVGGVPAPVPVDGVVGVSVVPPPHAVRDATSAKLAAVRAIV